MKAKIEITTIADTTDVLNGERDPSNIREIMFRREIKNPELTKLCKVIINAISEYENESL